MTIWSRLYSMPEFPLIMIFVSVILLFLVIGISNLICNWKINIKLSKLTAPFKKLSEKEKRNLAMSLFKQAREQADEVKAQGKPSDNQALVQNMLVNIMTNFDQQTKGLSELLALASLAKSTIDTGQEFDEIVVDVKEHIMSLKGELDEKSKNQLINALENNPQKFFDALSNNTAKPETTEELSSDVVADNAQDNLSAVTHQDSQDATASSQADSIPDDDAGFEEKEKYVKSQLPEYQCICQFFRQDSVDINGEWTFQKGTETSLSDRLVMNVYREFNNKRSNGSSDKPEVQFIYQFLSNIKADRNL